MDDFTEFLDYECLLSVPPDIIGETLPAMQISEKFKIFALGSIRILNDRVDLTYHIADSPEKDRELTIFLHTIGASLANGVWEIKIRSSEYEPLNIFRKLSLIESVVIGPLYLDSGVRYFAFRFHSSHLERISGLLIEMMNAFSGMRIEYLGRNRGMEALMAKFSDRVGMITVRFDMILLAGNHKDGTERKRFSWIRERRYNGEISNISFLYNSAEAPAHRENVRFITDAFFEKVTKSEVIGFLSRRFDEEGVVRIRVTSSSDGHVLSTRITTMDANLRAFLSILNETSKKFPDINLSLAEVQKPGSGQFHVN
ncbi:MAG: hypothetical protein M1476_05425 [Candidatus Thermoplasmatota archaeon]|nr:hypothetical protein [Candidatus Thermoplasmatota archaeon]